MNYLLVLAGFKFWVFAFGLRFPDLWSSVFVFRVFGLQTLVLNCSKCSWNNFIKSLQIFGKLSDVISEKKIFQVVGYYPLNTAKYTKSSFNVYTFNERFMLWAIKIACVRANEKSVNALWIYRCIFQPKIFLNRKNLSMHQVI